MRIVIGVDNGMDGAIALIQNNGKYLKSRVMPVIQETLKTKTKKGNLRKRRLYNEAEISRLFRIWKRKYDIQLVVVEDAIAMPKQSSQSTGSTFRGLGFMVGVMSALELPCQIVHPATWNSALCKGVTGDTKSRAIKVAMRLFPGVNLIIKGSKPHDGIADALLLAEYGRRSYKGEM